MHTLHELRSPALDLFFKSLNFFDTDSFYALLIPALWFGKDWKVGVRFFAVVLLSSFCLQELKLLFQEPRPFILDPTLAIIKVSGYSFPSGGATNALLLPALFIYHVRTRFSWIVGSLFFVFVSLSRTYLGVHYPLDLLGGWILGSLIFLFYLYCFPPIEKWIKKQRLLTKLAISQLLPFTLFLLCPVMKTSFVAMGMFLSLFICYRFYFLPPAAKKIKEQLLRGLIGIGVSFSCYILSKPVQSNFFIVFLLGLFLATISSYFCNKVKRSYCGW
jgi:membrane-associated phospholipid phosphatase